MSKPPPPPPPVFEESEQNERIHRHGFDAHDFAGLRPTSLVVEPVHAPSTMAGLDMTVGRNSVPNSGKHIYRVLACGHAAQALGGAVLEPGSLVFVRNAMLEGIDAAGHRLIIDLEHVHGVVRDHGREAWAKALEESEAPTPRLFSPTPGLLPSRDRAPAAAFRSET